MNDRKFPTNLKFWKYEIERLARQKKLTFPPVVYELVTMDEMSEIVAFHGFPNMPHHWRYGQESIRKKKDQKYGLGRFYELVIGTYPMYGYLMDSNTFITQKAVMAHVCGHGHVFQNNVFNALMDQDMLNVLGNDAIHLEEYCELFGSEKVKTFYDQALSLEYLIDQDALFINRSPRKLTEKEKKEELERRKSGVRLEPRDELPFYMEDFLNPAEWIRDSKKKKEEEFNRRMEAEKGVKNPLRPEKDVLLFLIKYAKLEEWQKEVLAMIRRHNYYFSGIMRTNFIHEGWASLWEERIMNEPHLMMDKWGLSVFAQEMAGVQRKSPFNPYKFAYDLLKDIEFRWNTGRHGRIWENCQSHDIKENWDMFIVFKNIYDEHKIDPSGFRKKWNEFLAFKQSLLDGELGWPKEFFVRDFFTNEILIPAWCDLQKSEEDYKNFFARLEKTEELEKGLEERVEKLREIPSRKDFSEEELRFEARRDLYRQANLLESELYYWTLPEVKRKLVYLEKLKEFKRKFQENKLEIPYFYTPEGWISYAEEYPGQIELGVGEKKIFEVASIYDNWSFMEEFFTKDFCEKNKYFLAKQKKVWSWEDNSQSNHWVLETRAFERIRKNILFRFTNANLPVIKVKNGNYNNNNELYLKHYHSGVDLDYWSKNGMYIKDVLERIFYLWGGDKPVHLETIITKKEEDKPWWFYWYQSKQKEGGAEENLQGVRVVFTWSENGYSREDREKVTFKAPF